MSPIDARDHARHDLDALSEAIDGRLPAAELEAVRERLHSCPDCGRAYEAMVWTRAQIGRLPTASAPHGLEDRIRTRLGAEAGRAARAVRVRRSVGLAVAAALLLALAAVLARFGEGPQPLPDAVADTYRARGSGRMPLAVESSDAARLETWLAAQRLGFPTRVFDLRMMGHELKGGATRVVAGRTSAVAVYRELASGREVLCLMLLASLGDLPAPDSTREHDGIAFRVYAVGGVHLVFWPEGDVLCVLAGEGDLDPLVQLAFAKAMKARPREG